MCALKCSVPKTLAIIGSGFDMAHDEDFKKIDFL